MQVRISVTRPQDAGSELAVAGQVWVLPDLANREQQAAVKTPPMDAVLHGSPRELLLFQVDNLIGALANFPSERVVLHTQDGKKALVVTETVDGLGDPKSYRHLVMPMRIPDPPEPQPEPAAAAGEPTA
jgi:hypothetical protein